MNNMEGLLLETREDDAPYVQLVPQSDEVTAYELQMEATEQSWNDPENLGHIESSFENHVAMIAKRSQELGIVNNYSPELLGLKVEAAQLQQTLISRDAFIQMMCSCPHDYGMTADFTSAIFGRNNAEHADNHDHLDVEKHKEEDDELDADGKPRKKKRWLFGVR